MKAKSFFLVLLLMFLLQGCFIEMLMDDMFGWIPGYQGSGPSSSSQNNKPGIIRTVIDAVKDKFDDDKENSDEDPLAQNRIDNIEWNCDHIPNSIMNEEGTCVCKQGYGDWYGQCVRLQSTKCYSDLDCGNGVRSKCSGTDTKISYRCDLVNNLCFPPETVSCKTEYGSNYICSNGNCIQKIVK